MLLVTNLCVQIFFHFRANVLSIKTIECLLPAIRRNSHSVEIWEYSPIQNKRIKAIVIAMAAAATLCRGTEQRSTME
jgi:hypothetical protein